MTAGAEPHLGACGQASAPKTVPITRGSRARFCGDSSDGGHGVGANQPFFVGRGDGRPTRVRQPMTQYKAVSADTGGVYTFAEHRLAIDFPLHVHHREDEGIYVLDGSLTARVGEEIFELRPGDFAFLAKGVPHSLTNTSEPHARFVFVSAPGGFEHLMDDFVEAAMNGHSPGSSEWQAVEEHHHLHFL